MPEWDTIAPYYDDLFQRRSEDVQFWVALAKSFRSPVLELACGTGRLTFPIAKAGISVVGIDISKPMLQRAREKLKQMTPTARQRVILFEKNGCSFAIPGKKFAAVFSPWGFIPVSEEEEVGLFRSVKQHLLPHGRFVIDHENISRPASDWEDYRLKEHVRTSKGLTLIRHAYNRGSATTRKGTILYLLDILDTKGRMKRIVTRRDYRLYTKEEIVRLVYRNGFIVESLYGDYDKSPWRKDSSRIIIIARPATNRLVDTMRTVFFRG